MFASSNFRWPHLGHRTFSNFTHFDKLEMNIAGGSRSVKSADQSATWLDADCLFCPRHCVLREAANAAGAASALPPSRSPSDWVGR